MAKNYFGVVLTTKEHDKYRLVVYRYKDPGILNTCPMCQLLRAIHKFQQEYVDTANIAAIFRLASGMSLAESCRALFCENMAWKSIVKRRLSRAAYLRPLR